LLLKLLLKGSQSVDLNQGAARTGSARARWQRGLWLAGVCAALWALGFGIAQAGGPGSDRNFDARIQHNQSFSIAEPPGGRTEAPPGIALTRDPTTGATRSILRATDYLTGPSLGASDPSATALAYLESNLDLLGLTASDLAESEITDIVYSEVTGATRVYLRQLHQELPVYGAQLQVNLNRDGRILSVNNRFLPNIAQAGLGQSANPVLEADSCTAEAGRSLGIASRSGPKISHRGRGRGRRTQLRWLEASEEPITSQLMWLPIRAGDLRLVWNLQLQPTQAQRGSPRSFFDFNVDASSGRVWTRFDWTSGARYRVYSQPTESPNHSTPLPPNDGRTLVTNPEDATASPGGWHFADTANLRGNNVDVYEDRNANDLPPEQENPPGVEPSCAPGQICDFPLDLTAPPANSISAAVANAFYWANTVHDIQYKYGFDEAAGNFQSNNFGRGGLELDHLTVEIQDGGSDCQANFSVPPDGQGPRMQLYTCSNTNPASDGALDNGVIIHEYAHGITVRQVGGPTISSCLNNLQQPGEGWSDWFTLVYTARPEDRAGDARTVGTYLFGQPVNGPGNRRKPYSTDPSVNDDTYASINDLLAPHEVGSVWAQALWKMYWALVEAHGFDPDLHNPAPGWAGNQRALLYVNEGLKNTLCSPTFVDARDGILQAALDNFGGEDRCTLWRAFAEFGLGTDANPGGPNSLAAVNGFSLLPECRAPGNTAPSIVISAPLEGSSTSEGEPVDFVGSANDLEDGDLTSGLAWTSNLDGLIGSGSAFQTPLSSGTHSVTASVSDSVGVSASRAVRIDVIALPTENSPPTLNILAPANRTRFRDTFAVFSGVASDPEEGDVSSKLLWTSNLDGVIGQGASFAASLSEGRHQITASVTDANGLSSSVSLARIECKGSCIAPTAPPIVGCDGQPNSGLLDDACGVCGGDGASCLGCDGLPNSGLLDDACGVCGGDGSRLHS
jgi:extracellular elastinolytic metalloproteinase